MSDDKETEIEEKEVLAKDEGDTEATKEEADVPDYNVTEEADDEGDKRLGKTREERADHKQMSNREKRQLRKKRLAQKFDAKDAIIKDQQEQLNRLASKMNEVDGRLSQVDQATLVQSYSESVAAFQAAERKHQEAFKDGDGAKATAAMREMYVAQKRIDDLEAIHARNEAVKAEPRAPQVKDPVMVAKAVSWAERNPWFKQGGADDESAIADTIAAKLVKEGFNPKTDGYWEELDDRLSARGIGGDDDDDEQQNQSQSQRERQPVTRQVRRSPPVGGGNGRGDLGAGKTAVTLPTPFINALKEAGIWDDPKRRNKAIAEHQRIKAEGNR